MFKFLFSVTFILLGVILAFLPVSYLDSPSFEMIKTCIAVSLFACGFIVVLWVPNEIIDTTSCKRNWCVCLVIFGSALIVVDQSKLGFLCYSIVLIGSSLNYLIPYFIKNQKVECNNVDSSA